MNKKILIGDPAVFAIESSLSEVYSNVSQMASGYFVLHIKARCFGVREPDATLLAGAYGEAIRRIARRGQHVTPFAAEPKAGEIIDAIGEAVYDPAPRRTHFFGLTPERFSDFIHASGCEWHRRRDEAFDDGSGIVQFDIGDTVRLIADNPPRDLSNWKHDPVTLVEISLSADLFYGILADWRDAFRQEWLARVH